MQRRALAMLITALGCGLAVTASAQTVHSVSDPVVAAAENRTPQSRVEGVQAINDALAAALVGAIATQFDKRLIEVKLDRVESTLAGLVQRELHGNARMRIGNDAPWIPVTFTALYDTSSGTVGFPSLVLGADGPGHALPVDDRLSRQLADEVHARLGSEFSGQAVHFRIDQAKVVEVGHHFLQLDANGVADFGVEGTTTAVINALYDPDTQRWIHLSYELGPAANRNDEPAPHKSVVVR